MLSLTVFARTPVHWQKLSTGLSYTKLPVSDFPQGVIHAFCIDLQHYDLKLARVTKTAREFPPSFADIASEARAVIAINGGFFSSGWQPLGLRVSASKTINPLRAVSSWPVFVIRSNAATLVKMQDYKPQTQADFALQSGPQLVADGKPRALSSQRLAKRSALCIRSPHKIILIATENALLSLAELGKLLAKPQKQGGLGCKVALNLDGGHSTQMYAKVANFSLKVFGIHAVADAILVVPK